LLAPALLTGGQGSTVTVEVANRTGAPSRVTASVRAPAGWQVHETTQRIPAFSNAYLEVQVTPPLAPAQASLSAIVTSPGRKVYGTETADVVIAPPAVS
jgi:uncharacterized protein YfaS (alpha-2-macroglobulin family)